MPQNQVQWWLPMALFLALAAAMGGVLLALNLRGGQPLEISQPPTPAASRQVYVEGAVNNPGIYVARNTDRLDDLLQAAGGAAPDADPIQVKLTVPHSSTISSPQKINVNTAEPWLLEALPSIGEKLAKAIVAYRKENGPFHFTSDLKNVSGITPKIYERIQALITVGE